MYGIKIYNSTKTNYFDLTPKCSRDIYANELKGFGNAFDIFKSESFSSTRVTNIKPRFPDITFTLIAKCYETYRSLIDFISANGTNKFIIERGDRLYDVYAKQLPKSEKNEFKILQEEFVFERVNYAYKEETLNFTFDPSYSSSVKIPLNVPHKLIGYVFSTSGLINNTFFQRLPVEVTATGELEENLNIWVEDQLGNRVSEVLMVVPLLADQTLIIDSAEKSITINNINAYDKFSRLKNSFLFLDNGKFVLGSNLKRTDTGKIILSIKQYFLD